MARSLPGGVDPAGGEAGPCRLGLGQASCLGANHSVGRRRRVLEAAGVREAGLEVSAGRAAHPIACIPPSPFSTLFCCPLHLRSRPLLRLATWAVVSSEPGLGLRGSLRVGRRLAPAHVKAPCAVMRWAPLCLAYPSLLPCCCCCPHRSAHSSICGTAGRSGVREMRWQGMLQAVSQGLFESRPRGIVRHTRETGGRRRHDGILAHHPDFDAGWPPRLSQSSCVRFAWMVRAIWARAGYQRPMRE